MYRAATEEFREMFGGKVHMHGSDAQCGEWMQHECGQWKGFHL
jgi:hypothetical protein